MKCFDFRNAIGIPRNKTEHAKLSVVSGCQSTKESGSSGPLVYAACFIGLVVTVFIFIFVEYRAKIYLLKDEMETNLHVIENYCITVNQKTGSSDAYERERERAHIITVGANDPSAPIEERIQQINAIGTAFSEQFKQEFDLTGNKPNSGYLAEMSSTMNIEVIYIFEPQYTYTLEPQYIQGEVVGFYPEPSIKLWYKYTLTFKNNDYDSCKVETFETPPTLHNDADAAGATIECKISASFYPPKNWYLSKRPMKTVYIWEAVDIVYATMDDRKQ